MKAFLNGVRISDKDYAYCQKVRENINTRFYAWLASTSAETIGNIEQQDELFGANTNELKDIALSASERKENQRLLLAVEVEGALAREQKKQAEVEIINKASRILTKRVYEHMTKALSNTQHLYVNVLRLPKHMDDLLDTLLTPNSSYKQLASVISSNHGLGEKLIEMVANKQFCRQIGREPRKIQDVQTAVGYVGMEGLRLILPIILIKSRIRFRCEHFPLLATKLWQHALLTSNGSRYLVKEDGTENTPELNNLLAGVLRFLGPIAVYQQFSQSFEESRTQLLSELRERNNRPLYNAMLQANTNPSIMTKLMLEQADKATLALLGEFKSERFKGVKNRLVDALTKSSPNEHDKWSMSLQQAEIFSQYELLTKSKCFPNEKLSKAFMFSCYISEEKRDEMGRRNLRQLNLREYIG
ncbi:MAG: hypothetical protein CL840_04610 [Crocinitomicaceae bacterium]|nr:hypothetical protein [Crocinitomicaceae bacterium]|tara:strand:- start:40677 stop:41924 length:1248 start_codon:yes stop_codon:yes gene_type:complete